jgi:hypothetical protein
MLACYAIATTAKPIEGDIASVLLTAASLALFCLSVLVAMLAVYGWREINVRISDEIARQVQAKQDEYRGLLKLMAGIFYSRLSRTPTESGYNIERKEFLDAAIVENRQALELLAGTEYEIRIKNNLAFALALDGSSINGIAARNLALELRSACGTMDAPDLVNTFAKVALSYHSLFDNPHNTLVEAQEALTDLISSKTVTDYHKENARRHLLAVNRALENLTTLNRTDLESD